MFYQFQMDVESKLLGAERAEKSSSSTKSVSFTHPNLVSEYYRFESPLDIEANPDITQQSFWESVVLVY